MNHNLPASIPLSAVRIRDAYWDRYVNLIPQSVIPYQWAILNDAVADAPPSHCLQNLRITAGEAEGQRQGTVFQDSDVGKWLEAVAYSLATHPDEALEKTADEVIALIGRAQQPDGYLNTYFTLVAPNDRWKNLTEGHELYCAGHLIEAAVAYYDVTNKTQLLDIVCRFADLIYSVFGPGEDQLHGCPGHPEIELALVRLYYATGNKRYAELAKYFIDVRGAQPNYFLQEMAQPDFKLLFPEFASYHPIYSQSHVPVRQQDSAQGHAVRAVYLYCAMADLAGIYQDDALLNQCKVLWDSIVNRRMFITGSIGSSGHWERFTTDYDLPNDSNYSETCASIGLARFGLRMARLTKEASYIDVVERALYNTIRAGISLQGDRYFYVNPLEVWPDCCMQDTSRAHVKAQRQKWFDVACCPTNVARTLTALGHYIYSATNDELFVNLFIQNQTDFKMNGQPVTLDMQTDYPKTGEVRLSIKADGTPFKLYLRMPQFADDFKVEVNGQSVHAVQQKGFCCIDRVWGQDTVTISFSIKPVLMHANPLVRANAGKVALVRGPEVYCFEQVDNGSCLAAVSLAPDATLQENWQPDLMGGTMLIECEGSKLMPLDKDCTFAPRMPQRQSVGLTAIPYGSWCNREPGEMIVWVKGDCV